MKVKIEYFFLYILLIFNLFSEYFCNLPILGNCTTCLDHSAAIEYYNINGTYWASFWCYDFNHLNNKNYDGYFFHCNQPMCGNETVYYDSTTRYRFKTSEFFTNTCVWVIWTKISQTAVKLVSDEFLVSSPKTGGFIFTPLQLKNVTLNLYSIDSIFPIISNTSITNSTVVSGERITMVIARSKGFNSYAEFYINGFELTGGLYIRLFMFIIMVVIVILL